MEFPFVKNIQTLFPCEDQGFLKEETKICCSIMHPDDLGRQPRLFQDAFRIYFSLPANERMSYIYCNEFRCNGIDGKYRWFLQKITFLKANGNGNPLLSYKYLC
jgi:hypothetical protein